MTFLIGFSLDWKQEELNGSKMLKVRKFDKKRKGRRRDKGGGMRKE